MKVIDWDGLDSDIHARIYGNCAADQACKQYSREPAAAREVVECINRSGQFRVNLTRVVGRAHRDEDFQCEILTADGLDNLATEYDPIEAVAICRAIAHADLRLNAGADVSL